MRALATLLALTACGGGGAEPIDDTATPSLSSSLSSPPTSTPPSTTPPSTTTPPTTTLTSTAPPTGSTTQPDAALDLGCLDQGCSLPAVGELAWAMCSGLTGNAPDTSVSWGETRYLSGQGASGIALTCASSTLVEADCPLLCDDAGLENPFYNSASKDCSCLGSLPADGTVATGMIDLVCGNRTADANVGAFTYTPGSPEVGLVASVTCRDGASNGSDACADALAFVNAELGTAFANAIDFGAGCSLSP